jgi:hypothetical protein
MDYEHFISLINTMLFMQIYKCLSISPLHPQNIYVGIKSYEYVMYSRCCFLCYMLTLMLVYERTK